MISVNYLTLLLIGLLGHGNKCVRVDIENEFLLLILLFDNMYTAVSIAFKHIMRRLMQIFFRIISIARIPILCHMRKSIREIIRALLIRYKSHISLKRVRFCSTYSLILIVRCLVYPLNFLYG